MTRIVIIVYRDDKPLTDLPYMITPIAEAWKEMGHDVKVVAGPQSMADGDIALLHVNLTFVPKDHLGYAKRFPVAINGNVSDISKRFVSRNLVELGDGYEGAVIVKTDLNSGGWREGLVEARISPERRAMRDMQKSLPWAFRTEMKITDYRVYPSAREVPEQVWTNRSLVVEKFIPEMRDGLYALRTWLFLGDKDVNTVSYSPHPIFNGSSAVRREDVEVPEDLRQTRCEMGFGYGKFHYVIVDGSAVLFDANRTATIGNSRPMEQYIERGRFLAQGLKSFL